MKARRIYEILAILIGSLAVGLALVSDLAFGNPYDLGLKQVGLIIAGFMVTAAAVMSMTKPGIVAKTISFFRETFLEKWMKRLVDFVKAHDWLVIVLIVLIALLFIWPKPYANPNSPDVAYYLSLAKNIIAGNGYVNPDLTPALYRGPVFPYLISLVFLVLGNSFTSALIMMRVFWLFTVVISYLIGKELFNTRVGLGSALLVLTTFIISRQYDFIWTDGIVNFLVLVIQLLLWLGIKKNHGIPWYILLGVLTGIAYLVKQTAITIVPLSLIYWLFASEFRSRNNLLKILLYLVTFSIFFFGWMGFVHFSGGTPGQVTRDLGIASRVFAYVTNIFSNSAPTSVISAAAVNADRGSSFLQVLSTFYQRDLASFFWYAPLFLFVPVFLLYQAVRNKDRSYLFLLAGLIPFSVVLPASAVTNFGQRAYLYIYFILLICTVAAIDHLEQKLPKKTDHLFFILAVFVLIIFQIPKNTSRITEIAWNKDETGKYFAEYSNLVNWINKNVDPEAGILASERVLTMIHILTPGNRVIHPIHPCLGENSFYIAEACSPPYISLWINQGITDPNIPRDDLKAVSETALISKINTEQIDYVVVTDELTALVPYLKIHPGFEIAAAFDTSIVFRVLGTVHPISSYPDITYSTCLGIGTSEYLTRLKAEHPAKYASRITDLYLPWMGLQGQDLESYMTWQGCQVDVTYTGDYSELK